MSTPTVVLVGTLDTKGEEYAYLRTRLEQAGVAVLVVDVGTQGPPRTEPDLPREALAAAGGFELSSLTERGAAVQAMCAAAPLVVRGLFDDGRCQGVLAAGGSGGTAIVISAWRRSCPWFQRRNSWCMTRPTSPLTTIASSAASHHDMPASCTKVSAM